MFISTGYGLSVKKQKKNNKNIYIWKKKKHGGKYIYDLIGKD